MLPTDAELIVASAYADLVGSPAPTPFLDHHVSAYAEHGDVVQLRTAITQLPAYAVTRIEQAYELVYGRAPLERELTVWGTRIRRRAAHPDDLPLHLLSVEAEDLRRTPEAFVALVYAVAHERVLNVRDADFWTQRIDASGRAAVAETIWRAEEALKMRVTRVFRELLWREVDALGMQTMYQVAERHGVDAVRSDVIGSLEYRQFVRDRHRATARG